MHPVLTLTRHSALDLSLYNFKVPQPEQDIVDAEAAFVRGEDTALKSAYDDHGALIYTLCRRSVPDDRAADVTNSTPRRDDWPHGWAVSPRIESSTTSALSNATNLDGPTSPLLSFLSIAKSSAPPTRCWWLKHSPAFLIASVK